VTTSAGQDQPGAAGRWRRLFRLSLRTLLVAIFVFAVWLGLTFNRVRQQRAAVARIQQLGGTIQYAHEIDSSGRRIPDPSLPGSPWLRRLLGAEFFDSVVRVDLDGTAVTNDDLRIIGRLRGVESMHLNSTKVSDAGVYELRSWRKLHYLGLMETRITSTSLEHLAGLQELNCLPLGKTAVDDAGLVHLRGRRKLMILGLGETRVTSQGLQHLHSCTELTDLSLRSTAVDDDALETLLSLPNLGRLDVSDSNISGPGLLTLTDALPEYVLDGNLIDFYGSADKKVARSTVQWAPVTARIVALDGEDRLKLIDFSWCNIQDEHLAALHGLKHVELIDLRGSDVTKEGVAALREALPQCEVRY
jgi:hypothetical protein